MSDPRSQSWVFGSTQYSSGITVPGNMILIGATAPAMETNTAKLLIQKSDDPASVADAAATWVTLGDGAGNNRVFNGASTAASKMVWPRTHWLYGGIRVRLLAVQSDGTTAVNQNGQEVEPVLLEARAR